MEECSLQQALSYKESKMDTKYKLQGTWAILTFLLTLCTFSIATARDSSCPNCVIGAYYYGWWDNPTFGHWRGWNVCYDGHWQHPDTDTGIFHCDGTPPIPPDDIQSYFYPSLGPYSSKNTNTIDQHIAWMTSNRIGVLIYNWLGSPDDAQDHFSDDVAPLVMSEASSKGIKVAFMIGNYPGRTITKIKSDIDYIMRNYAKKLDQQGNLMYHDQQGNPTYWTIKKKTHAAADGDTRARPVIYIFATSAFGKVPDVWLDAIGPVDAHPDSIRKPPYYDDCVLLAQTNSGKFAQDANFDGGHYYTGLGENKDGDDIVWASLKGWAADFHQKELIFAAPVAPGKYNLQKPDTDTKKWSIDRKMIVPGKGQYLYDYRWRMVNGSGSDWVTIITFNEFHEGTQIEPSVQHTKDPPREDKWKCGFLDTCLPQNQRQRDYCDFICDYGKKSEDPGIYLKKTKNNVRNFVPPR